MGKQRERGRKGASPVQTGAGMDVRLSAPAPEQLGLSQLLTRPHVERFAWVGGSLGCVPVGWGGRGVGALRARGASTGHDEDALSARDPGQHRAGPVGNWGTWPGGQGALLGVGHLEAWPTGRGGGGPTAGETLGTGVCRETQFCACACTRVYLWHTLSLATSRTYGHRGAAAALPLLGFQIWQLLTISISVKQLYPSECSSHGAADSSLEQKSVDFPHLQANKPVCSNEYLDPKAQTFTT